MSDHISRQAAIYYLQRTKKSFGTTPEYSKGFVDGLNYCISFLETLPSAYPKKGKWVDCSNEGYVVCPFCHSATNCDDNKEELRYCYSCGADMRESE